MIPLHGKHPISRYRNIIGHSLGNSCFTTTGTRWWHLFILWKLRHYFKRPLDSNQWTERKINWSSVGWNEVNVSETSCGNYVNWVNTKLNRYTSDRVLVLLQVCFGDDFMILPSEQVLPRSSVLCPANWAIGQLGVKNWLIHSRLHEFNGYGYFAIILRSPMECSK